jgi:tetratricopeptide (TPR) repeat protein
MFLVPLNPIKKQYMFNKNFKLILAALVIATAVWQFTETNIGNGIMLILFSLIFVFLYFKNEVILLAFLRLRKQDFPGAKKWLDKIGNPKAALVTKQQGYYNYLNGLMVSQTNMNEAEKYFKKAVELGLSMDADMAMTKLNLAGIAMTKNRKREAELLLTEAKKLDKHNMLEEQMKMMKQQMKKMGQPRQQFGKAASRGGRVR